MELAVKGIDSAFIQNPKPYECVPIPGKGLGLVATRRIKYGELIIEEEPVITIPRFKYDFDRMILVYGDSSPLEKEFTHLSEENKAKVMSLHCVHKFENPDNPVMRRCSIFASNAHSRGDSDTSVLSVLCLETSRLNHSCIPNVYQGFEEPYERVYACRDIDVGEELCNNYGHLFKNAEERKRELKSIYDFDCKCPICDATSDQILISDGRRKRYEEVEALVDALATSVDVDPVKGLFLLSESFQLLRLEKLLLPIIEAHLAYQAFVFLIALYMKGQKEELETARYWSKRGYKALLIAKGPRSFWTRKLLRYTKNPQIKVEEIKK